MNLNALHLRTFLAFVYLAQPNWKFWLHSWLFTFQLCPMYTINPAKPVHFNWFHSALRTATIFYYYCYCYHHFYYIKSMKHTVFALGKLYLFLWGDWISDFLPLSIHHQWDIFYLFWCVFFYRWQITQLTNPMYIWPSIDLSHCVCVYCALNNKNSNK